MNRVREQRKGKNTEHILPASFNPFKFLFYPPFDLLEYGPILNFPCSPPIRVIAVNLGFPVHAELTSRPVSLEDTGPKKKKDQEKKDRPEKRDRTKERRTEFHNHAVPLSRRLPDGNSDCHPPSLIRFASQIPR